MCVYVYVACEMMEHVACAHALALTRDVRGEESIKIALLI